MDAFRLDGKTALVTGGGSGIGRATSITLAEAGAAVAVHYFGSKTSAEEVATSIRAIGGRAVLIQADLKVRGEGDRVVSETVGAFGVLDILVNNAGHLLSPAQCQRFFCRRREWIAGSRNLQVHKRTGFSLI
jgi:3-oxoacyl-[acyl-carrier protein] reductase